jgi:galactokinase
VEEVGDALIEEAFGRRFGAPPEYVVRAPGRVNLIGEHTDYNDGFVLPMAIDRATGIALRLRADRRVHLFSTVFDEEVEIDLDALAHGGPSWSEYVKGVAGALLADGAHLRGFDGAVAGDVPMGAGLSSSASLELATARALATSSDLDWDPKAMALRAQRAENEWVGVKCGIMDQLVSAAAEEGAALLIDCRSLETTAVPLPPDVAVIVLDTATRRGLVESAYNERRRQCEEAARLLDLPALRDVTPARLAAGAVRLGGTTLRRARHVVTENERVLRAVEALRKRDVATLGDLLDASHESLRDDFEVSSPALDAMVAAARKHPACYGARMTGAGFGGCAVALVKAGQTEPFLASVLADYEQQTGKTPKGYVCRASAGASVREPTPRARE